MTHESPTPEGDLISRAAVLAIFQPETSMVRKRICDDIRALPASQAQGEGLIPVSPDDLERANQIDARAVAEAR